MCLLIHLSAAESRAGSVTQGSDIAVVDDVVEIATIVVTGLIIKETIAAVSGRNASSLGSIGFSSRFFSFHMDDVDIHAMASGMSSGSGAGSGSGDATASGTLRFTGAGTVTLDVSVSPKLQVSKSNPLTESGSASFTTDIDSPTLGSLFHDGETITDGTFDIPKTQTISFDVTPLSPVELNFTYAISASAQVVTPEPASLTLLGIGIAGMAGCAWRRRKTLAKS
jgi:hypothetical protein